jgi:hypothetical protein
MFEANIILNFLIMKKKKLNVKLNLGKHKISNLTGTKIVGGADWTSYNHVSCGIEGCGTIACSGVTAEQQCNGDPFITQAGGSVCECL